MSLVTPRGDALPPPSRVRPAAPTAAQSRACRNACLLHDAEVGRFDPATGRTRPWSTRELAPLYGRSVSAINRALMAARRLRDQVMRAVADD